MVGTWSSYSSISRAKLGQHSASQFWPYCCERNWLLVEVLLSELCFLWLWGVQPRQEDDRNRKSRVMRHKQRFIINYRSYECFRQHSMAVDALPRHQKISICQSHQGYVSFICYCTVQ